MSCTNKIQTCQASDKDNFLLSYRTLRLNILLYCRQIYRKFGRVTLHVRQRRHKAISLRYEHRYLLHHCFTCILNVYEKAELQ